jgi:hypothetical protein
MKATPICIATAASVLLAACGTTVTERAASGGLAGAALGAAVGHSALTGALVGGAAGAAVGAATTPKRYDNGNRRQYYDDRAGRYYYYDPGSGRYFWENGTPRDRP